MNYIYDVSIVVVNYNGKRYLYNFFEALCNLKHNNISFEVVFVDNHSTDGSIEFIRECGWDRIINLKIISNEENQGFAKGNNTGVANSDGKYIVFLNNDTAVEPQWLQALYYCIEENQDCGMVASKLLFFYDFIKISFSTTDNIVMQKKLSVNGKDYCVENKFCKNLLYNEQLTCFGNTEIAVPLLDKMMDYELVLSFEKYNPESDYVQICGKNIRINQSQITIPIPYNIIETYRYSIIQNAGSDVNENYDGFDIGMGEVDSEVYNKCKEINAGCGASIIIKKDDFLKVGQFDEKFFMYYEDVDLSYRIRKSGKKIIYCPESIVRHVHTGSSKEWSPFFAYHVYRNKLLFVYKNISKTIFWKLILRQLCSGIKNRDKIKLKTSVDAFRIIYLPFKEIRGRGN